MKSKALTGLDRESAHPLQLYAVKQSSCTAVYPGAAGRFSNQIQVVVPTQGDNQPVAPGYTAVQQLRFTV